MTQKWIEMLYTSFVMVKRMSWLNSSFRFVDNTRVSQRDEGFSKSLANISILLIASFWVRLVVTFGLNLGTTGLPPLRILIICTLTGLAKEISFVKGWEGFSWVIWSQKRTPTIQNYVRMGQVAKVLWPCVFVALDPCCKILFSVFIKCQIFNI